MAPGKILLADDDADITRLLKKMMEEEGYAVVVAADGEEALAAYKKDRPDLLILDVAMPKMDGFAVCKEVRALDPSVLILMLTGQRTQDNKVEGLNTGADGYITKPFGARELIARVHSLFRRLNR